MTRKNSKKKESPRYVFTGHENIADSYTEITGQEYKALLSVNSTDARWIYFVISFHRDFETGMAGLNPKISSGMLRRTISHKSDVGKKERKISNNHIQRWIDQLEKVGLIEDRGNHVFYLPMARKHPSKQKISNRFGNTLNVTVTNAVTNYPYFIDKTPINTEQNTKTEVLLNVLQEPILSQKNEGVLSQSLLPIQNNNLTKLNYTEQPNFLSTAENKFLNLFTDLKLNINPLGDLKAITAAKALVQAGVSIEVAAEALKIKLAGYQGDRTPHPSYFTQAIIDYKRDLDAIKQQPQEIDDAKSNRPSKQSRTSKYETPVERARRELQESLAESIERAGRDKY